MKRIDLHTLSQIGKIKVSLQFGEKIIAVGELVRDRVDIYFKYFQTFIDLGLEISPFKLPLTSAIQKVETQIFDGVYGVFNDSLPDGWGRLLMDRKIISSGLNLADINPLHRLAITGVSGPGALIYQPMMEQDVDFVPLFDLDDYAVEIQKILIDQPSIYLDQLFLLCGSSGGARPKINIGYDASLDKIHYGPQDLPSKFEPWIIKFSSAQDHDDLAKIEYAYYLMALDAGLIMSPCRLFKSESGTYYFGTKRFDRDGKKRLHMHSAAGLLHDNFRLSMLDYGHLMDATFRLEKSVAAYEKILRLAAFNVYSHNLDDHSKNVAFLMNDEGEWQLSPSYDLTFSYSTYGHHSTMVAGESKNPGKEHLNKLATHFGVHGLAQIMDRVKSVLARWSIYADQAMIGNHTRDEISKVLKLKNSM